MRRRSWAGFIIAALVVSTGALLVSDRSLAEAQSIPPSPALYSGVATAAGAPVPNGHTIVARIGGDYESLPIVVNNGRYEALSVAPLEDSFAGGTITFYLDSGVQADQSHIFEAGTDNLTFDLTFVGLPTPTPTITPPLPLTLTLPP